MDKKNTKKTKKQRTRLEEAARKRIKQDIKQDKSVDTRLDGIYENVKKKKGVDKKFYIKETILKILKQFGDDEQLTPSLLNQPPNNVLKQMLHDLRAKLFNGKYISEDERKLVEKRLGKKKDSDEFEIDKFSIKSTGNAIKAILKMMVINTTKKS